MINHPMDHTLFVSDMDGTLMNNDSRVSDRSVAIINELIDRHGLLFTVATARTTATVVPLTSGIHATLPMIILSGAVMWNPLERQLSHPCGLSPAATMQVCHICERHGVHPMVYRHDGNVLVTHHYGPLADYEQAFIAARDHTPYKRFVLDDPDYAVSERQALLIFAMSRGDALQAVHDDIARQVECTPIVYHDNTDPSLALLEVYAPGCNKAAAMTRLAHELGVSRVVAFGDNLNDMPMLRAADHSVAVANAVPEVRQQADEVIGPNTDDSVAHYLMHNSQIYKDAT